MKHINVTHSVMDKVARYEEKNTSRWLIVFSISLGAILFVLGFLTWSLYTTTIDMHTWDLVELFAEDRSIVGEFWQDTVSIIFAEVPPVVLFLIASLILVAIFMLIRTRKKRKVIARVRTELAKHKKNGNNTPYRKE